MSDVDRDTGLNPSRDEVADTARPSRLRALASDVFVGLLLAALVVVTMLFASGISRFVYIDF